MASKSIPVTLRGRYVTQSNREWDSFSDDKGREVKAGRSVTLYLCDDGGKLREVECRDIPLAVMEPLTFGVEVEIETEATPWNRDFRFAALQVKRVQKAG